MANIANVGADVNRLKQSYKNMLALGEGANGADFRMVFEDYPDMEFLVQTAKEPELRRMPIEGFGAHGVGFTQQGVLKNAGEMDISVKEVVTGKAREFMHDWVKNKRYLKVTLARISESQTESTTAATYPMEDCWIEVEGGDFSADDGGVLSKPSFTMHYHFFPTNDEDGETLAWE